MSYAAPATGVLSGPASEFRRDVRTAPLHPASRHVVEHLVEQTLVGGVNLNCLQYGVAVYEVGEDVPGLDVTWRGQADDVRGYAGLLGPTVWSAREGNTWPATTGAFRNVPLVSSMRGAVGTDGAMSVLRRGTDELWEFWQPRYDPATGKWSAAWGGYLPNYSASSGQHTGTLGVCASGLVAAAGAVTIGEVRAGRIEHALALAIPHVVGKVFGHPAVRVDGSGTSTLPTAIHEGQRFRLRAGVDVSTLTYVPWPGARPVALHPIAKLIADAAQRLGFIVTDRAGSVAVAAEDGVGALVAGASGNPWSTLLQGKAPWQVMLGFPWADCEALPFGYGKGVPFA